MKHLKLLRSFGAILLFSIPFSNSFAGDPKNWEVKREPQKCFIENKGQFYIPGSDEKVLYAYEGNSTRIYFTAKGVTYSFLKTWPKEKEEKMKRIERRMGYIDRPEEWRKIKKEELKQNYETDVVNFVWENAATNVQLIAERKTSNYYSYSSRTVDGKMTNENFIEAFEKITYKNLYPGIDVEYTFHPKEGIKYAVIVHPGADPSLLKMKYDNSDALSLLNGDLNIETKFGKITDHAPVTFYENNNSSIISSEFIKTGNTISFKLGSYDNTKTVVIDPWTVTPTFATNWDCVWECEKDGAGNVYIIGGVMPMQLLKYNSAGALQWTYSTPYDTTAWLGTVATDNAGNSYVTLGSTAEILKVNTAGGLVWSNSSPGGGLLIEFWTITFNCDQTLLVIGGTGGSFSPTPYIYNMSTTTGNITSSLLVHGGGGFTGMEIRAITSCGNGKYFYMSHDSIGYVDQNFSFCPTGPGGAYRRSNSYSFGYKCENWRKNNTGICAIKANTSFVYTHKGNTVDKRDITTANIITSSPIAGGVFGGGFGGNFVENSGIDIDVCGNVYVGSKGSVKKYDANLVLLATYPVSFNVYDVHVTTAGDIIACGSTGDYNSASRPGYIQSIPAGACATLALTCCNPSICAPSSICVTAAPVTLQAATAGGTWSGPGVSPGGVFNPATAGVGTWTITYTLACGAQSVTIVVNPCTAMTLCQGPGSTATVSGGSGPYQWQQQVTTTPCVAGFGFCAGPFTQAGPPVTSWSTFATGTTATMPGTYPIQVVDNAGTIVTIASAAAYAALPFCTACPTLTANITAQVNVACFGGSTGSFSVTTTGGATPWDYTLMQGATTIATFTNVSGAQAFTGLPAGTYTLNIQDNNNCPGTATITITQPASAVAVVITGSTPTGCGSPTGTATAQASGGTSPWDYVWTGASGVILTTNNITTSNTVTGLAAGTYTITITDANNCTTNTTVVISSAGAPTVNITAQTNVLCFGGSTGGATANATGGSSPYDYVWTGASGTLQTTLNITVPNPITGLAAGTYTVAVTDNAGCTGTTTVTITQPPSAAAVVITGSTDAACGGSTGTATAQASGGTSPWDYVWTGASGVILTTNNITTSNTVTGLAAGTYTITFTDANNCTANTTVTINNTGAPTVNITAQTNVLCFGASTGGATANASGGSGPYDYVWTSASGTLQTTLNVSVPDAITGLAAGTYTITVTDNAGCVGSTTVTITQPATALSSSTTAQTNVLCFGGATGSATVAGSGGTIGSGYTYSWAPSGGSAATATGLAANTYTVTVTDANSCTITQTVTITQPAAALSSSITSQTNVLCFGGATGSATIAGSGGTIGSGYTYVWAPSGGSAATATGLAANTYTVTVTDANSCTTTQTVVITQPASAAAVVITATVDAPCGTSTGSTTAQASGGSGPYDYVWTGASGTLQTTNNVSGPDVLAGLGAGTYTITITDDNGCTANTTAVVNNVGGATVNITSQTNVLCFGATSGAATASATGGSGPYDYVWTGASGTLQTTLNVSVPDPITGLGAGTYTVSVTDNAGCVTSVTVTITQPASALALNLVTFTDATCGNNNGSATVAASGGTIGAGYSYSWAPSGGSAASATGLGANNYTVTTTDANGCSTTLTVPIINSTGPTSNISAQTNISCFGGTTGSATVNATGGTGTYTYSWTGGGGTSAIATNLAAGTYTVTVDDGTCATTSVVTITQPALLQPVVNTVSANCGASDGSAGVTTSGGSGPVTYLWSPGGATTTSITGLPAGTYTVTATDSLGCVQTGIGVVGNTGSATAFASVDTTITLGDDVQLNASGGTTYTWSPITGLSCVSCPNPIASPQESTTYCVSVDSLGCTDTACVRVFVDIPCPTNKDLAVPNAFSPNNDGHNDIFCLRGWDVCVTSFTIYIYDRWGEKVFFSEDPAFCWDGMYKGKPMDPAVFVYFITANFSSFADKVEQKGNISLIR